MCFSIQVTKNVNYLSDTFGAKIDGAQMLNLQSLLDKQSHLDSIEFAKILGLKHSSKKKNQLFKLPDVDFRVYSNYFANIIVSSNDERLLQPMRYRVRPFGSKEEIPSKFNVFNARLDSLENRQTWIPLFMKCHGLIAIDSFFEWVNGNNGKTRLISFRPRDYDMMWVPVLFDEWISKDGSIRFKSFAIITDEPPEDILKMGHDRCPIFLDEKYIDDWLCPENKSKKEIYEILSKKQSTHYEFSWVD